MNEGLDIPGVMGDPVADLSLPAASSLAMLPSLLAHHLQDYRQ